MGKFKKGQTVICIINSRATLTVGAEYSIIDVYESSEVESEDKDIFKGQTLVIENDTGESIWYESLRFMDKNEFRNYKINEVLK